MLVVVIEHWDDPTRWRFMADPNPHLRDPDQLNQARLARQIAAEVQAEDRAMRPTPRYFIPASERYVRTTPAGESLFRTTDPLPNRIDPHQQRIDAARLAREVERQDRMWSYNVSGQRHFNAEDYEAVVSYDRFNRRRVDWVKVAEGDV